MGRRIRGCAVAQASESVARHLVETLEGRVLMSTVPSGFVDSTIASNLISPTAMAFAPDGRLFVAQQNGIIRVVKNGKLLSTPFATVPEDDNGERGLLGIAIDPNFSSNHQVYVYYTAKSPTVHNRISMFVANGDVATEDSGGNYVEKDLFDLPAVGDAIWHMGGALQFGSDGKLLVSVGDYEDGTNSQNLNVLMGKILRINADGSIPTDNPFYTKTTGLNRAIWAYGLRNPFTTAVQAGTGLFYIDDVGDTSREEIDQGVAGANYGWPDTQGYTTDPRYTSAIYAYSHSDGQCVVGGAFYSGVPQVFPSQYKNQYFFGDFGQGWMRTMDPTTHKVSDFATGLNFPTGMSLSPDGSIWYISRGQNTGGLGSGKGSIHEISYTLNTGPHITDSPSDELVAAGLSATFSVAAVGTGTLKYQWQRNDLDIDGANDSTYVLDNTSLADSGATFRCIVSNTSGSSDTSDEATLTVVNSTAPQIAITTPTADQTYVGNSVIGFSGTAVDAEEGVLPASDYTWTIELHHEDHFHPFETFTGVTSGNFTIPTSGETSIVVAYRVTLSVTDSTGLTTTTFTEVHPVISQMTVDTSVPGLSLMLDGENISTPDQVPGVVGITRELSAPATQTLNGDTYVFTGWSDNGAATHDISFPADPTTYTANYAKQDFLYVSDLQPSGTPKNGNGAIKLDESNGGKTLTLAGQTYAKGLGTFANSDVSYSLAKLYSHFITDVGVDDEVGSSGTVRFQVYLDGTKAYDSGEMQGSSATKSVDLDVTGKSTLRLVVDKYDTSTTKDSADWAGARLTFAGPVNPPPLPTAFTGTGSSPTSITLSWIDPSNQATAYKISRSSDGVSFESAGTVNGTTRTFTDTGLTPGLQYTYQIYAMTGPAVAEPLETTAVTWSAPVLIEAEDATLQNSVLETTHTGATGVGYVNYGDSGTVYSEWTLAVPTAGTYTLTFRYSDGTTSDRNMVLSVNGKTVNSKLVFPKTTNWDTWKTTAATSVTLAAGTDTVRLALGSTKAPNVDSMSVGGPSTVSLTTGSPTPTPSPSPSPTPPPTPTLFEAENGTIVGSQIGTNEAGYTGTGFIDFVTDNNEYVEWNMNAPQAGSYTLDFRFANGASSDRWVGLMVNGTVINAKLPMKRTGSWTTWSDVTATVNLLSGQNTVRVYLDGSKGPNLDSMKVTGPSTVTPL